MRTMNIYSTGTNGTNQCAPGTDRYWRIQAGTKLPRGVNPASQPPHSRVRLALSERFVNACGTGFVKLITQLYVILKFGSFVFMRLCIIVC